MIKRGKAEQRAARSERLSAALRENLKRRKAQARGRAGIPADNAGAEADPGFRPNAAPKADDKSRGPGR